MKCRISVCCGTRPEVIKMAPVIRAFKDSPSVELEFILTGQHSDLLEGLLNSFDLKADIELKASSLKGDLNSFSESFFQTFNSFTSKSPRPDLVLVHGDTATSFHIGLYCFHRGIPFAHVEAGLRSGSLKDPFPEEFYRQSLSKLASFHLCTEESSRENLLNEGISKDIISVVGNSLTDAVKSFAPSFEEGKVRRKEILVTLHRRENRDRIPFLIRALAKLAQENLDFTFIYVAHPSVDNFFSEFSFPENLKVAKPLPYPKMIDCVSKAHLIITDSAGIQEEAAIFGTPTLVCRKRTERQTPCILVGDDTEKLTYEAQKILGNRAAPMPMLNFSSSPSIKIREAILRYLEVLDESNGYRCPS